MAFDPVNTENELPINIDPNIPLSEEVNAYLIDSLNREIKPLHLPVRKNDAKEHIRSVFDYRGASTIFRGITTLKSRKRPGCKRGYKFAEDIYELNSGENALIVNEKYNEEKVGRKKVRADLLLPIKQTEEEIRAMFSWTEAE